MERAVGIALAENEELAVLEYGGVLGFGCV